MILIYNYHGQKCAWRLGFIVYHTVVAIISPIIRCSYCEIFASFFLSGEITIYSRSRRRFYERRRQHSLVPYANIRITGKHYHLMIIRAVILFRDTMIKHRYRIVMTPVVAFCEALYINLFSYEFEFRRSMAKRKKDSRRWYAGWSRITIRLQAAFLTCHLLHGKEATSLNFHNYIELLAWFLAIFTPKASVINIAWFHRRE